MNEDEIETDKAPFVEHLVELRSRVIKMLVALTFGFAICAFFADDIFNVLLWPFERAVGDIGEVEMIYTAPQEFFITRMKLALFGAVLLAFPIIAVQVYMFVAPGLYNNERRVFVPFLVAAPILFLLGGALVYFLIMPMAMTFFLSHEQIGAGVAQIHLLPRVSEYLSLIITLILAFGICFQLPVVLALLACAQIVDTGMLRSNRRYAIVLVFIVAAALTPPDPISQIGLALPILLLYESSIIAVFLIERKRCASAKSNATV